MSTSMTSKYFTSGAAEAQNIPLLEMMNPNTAQTLQDSFLSCSICYDVYTEPKCLPCLHTFCCSCLISYMQSQEVYGARRKKGFPCPVCKQFISITNHLGSFSEWADELKHNFMIQNMIDMVIRKSDQERKKSEERTTDDDVPPQRPPPRPSAPPQRPPPPTPSAPPQRLPPPRPSAPPQLPVLPRPSAPPLSVYSNTPSDSRSLFHGWSNQSNLRPQTESPDSPDHPSRASYGRQNSTSMPELNPGFHSPAGHTNAAAAGAGSRGTTPGVSASNTSVSYTETAMRVNKTYEMAARSWTDYKPPKISDICCLPKQNSVLVLDWGNRCVKFIKDIFLGRNVTTSNEVVGRPCSLELLDKVTESRIVVSVLDRKKMYFLSVPDLDVVNVSDTISTYRGVTVLSPTTILASSEDEPAHLDLLRINHRCKIVNCTRIYRCGFFEGSWNGDLAEPLYIKAMSATQFAVSDFQRRSLVFFKIENGKKAVRMFTVTPPDYRCFLQPGGLCYHNDSMYMVDSEKHEVHKVSFSAGIRCETILKQRDGVYRPSSICVGPRGELCVTNWEGKVTIFKQRV
ncbi:uncharacterized protein LOC124276630 [Haliotis rubra]|uniref:uncharacterized protein LOC124276630 n=1 Tax=Haliotis rubra TaxID=36100 RepID=UPI001EE57917|nr:uncharacterized protein LOC124276630 [Haliotis rubra]XP_046568245.1 uncharacterized protein LOC124276630 [Haliotis rubra]XP_046568246.1 uncharacterized protein LOC124276630 [Haliotis rubra]XP_046568247.1 uncharacterized protein LOC124276630 [Haliotis rubra]XP_046568248.1 uncharacterized protein LOC124276630 [Haliotis rubra]